MTLADVVYIFLAVPPLYDTSRNVHKASRIALGVVAIACIVAAATLTPLLWFATRNPSFFVDAVILPCLSSSAFSFLALLLTFAVSERYVWNAQAIVGVAVAAVATGAYSFLLANMRSRSRNTLRKKVSRLSESEAALMHAPRSHRVHSDSRAPSSLSTRQQNQQDTHWGPDAIAGHDEHGHNHSITPAHPSPSLSTHNSIYPPGRRGSTTSYVHEQATTLEVPVQTIHVPPEPEDEQTRQRMLGLLLQQTSEQARANPDRSTFKIELPEHMRHALRQDTLTSIGAGTNEYRTEAMTLLGGLNQSTVPSTQGHATSGQNEYGHAPPSTQQSQNKSHHTQQPSHDTIAPPSSAAATAALSSSSRPTSFGGASIQATPARMYGDWKTREDRRREIELGKR
ncbi:MAG: hypothetical protein M1831_001044 [Alyxoria varia]|nr:MAG: hypothetical protein M1831_001044 [Alyxoria varia]